MAIKTVKLLFLISNLFFFLYADDLSEEEQGQRKLLEADTAYEQYYLYVREIMNSFADSMAKELKLEWVGEGGMMHKEVEELQMKFKAKRRASIEEARALEVYLVNRFIQTINSHQKIQPFLKVRPFTFRHVSISVSFDNVIGPHSDGNIEWVINVSPWGSSESESSIVYCWNQPFTERLEDILKEPFLVADKLSKAANLKFPFTHKTKEPEASWDHVLYKYREKVWIMLGLECRRIGGDITKGIKEIGANFEVKHPASQKQAREIMVYAVEKLLETINQNEKLRSYLHDQPLLANRVKMRIRFTNSRGNTFHDGSLESVVLEDNELSYFQEVWIPDETNPEFFRSTSVKLLIKEPYPEALHIVADQPRSSILSIIREVPGYVYRLLLTYL